MHKIFFSFFFFVLAFSMARASVTIRFDEKFPDQQKIEIYRFYKGKTFKIGSYTGIPGGVIEVNDFTDAGLYLLTLKGFDNKAEFLYNPSEKMELVVDMQHLSNGEVTIEHSPDNQCYANLIRLNTIYDAAIDSLYLLRRSIPITLPDYYTRSRSIDSLFVVYAREKNGRLTYLQFNYPHTYTVNHLLPYGLYPLSSPEETKKFQTPYAYIFYNYFKYVTPDKALLRHYGFDDYLLRYFSGYTEPDEAGIKTSIDQLTTIFKKDTAVSTYVAEFFVKVFLEARNPELALYVMGQSGEGCGFDLGENQAAYLANYTHVQPGNIVDDIVLNDIRSTPVSLSNTCKKYTYTVLVFWTSWCAHCQKSIPALKEQLNAYKKKVQVFAVSLDENTEEWEKFVTQNKLEDWVHVSERKPIPKSALAPRFMVTHTPTVFLLDPNRMIVSKNLTNDQLVSDLGNYLK